MELAQLPSAQLLADLQKLGGVASLMAMWRADSFTMATPPPIPRGSLVVYESKLYYYQPNGESCYLFDAREHVGSQTRRRHAVGRAHVRLATPEDIELLGLPPPPPVEPMVPLPVHPHVPFSAEELRWQAAMAEPPPHPGRLIVITGPMFAGKSTELTRRIRIEQFAKRMCVTFKYAKDTRYGADDTTLKTHDQASCAAIAADNGYDVEEYLRQHREVRVVGIDEGQFITGLASVVERILLALGCDVIVAALDLKFDRTPFEETSQLMFLADDVIRLKAVCAECCSRDGIFTRRIGDSTETEVIGGAEAYKAVCRACYVAASSHD